MADQHETLLENLSFLSMKTIIGYMTSEQIFELSIKSETFNKFAETVKVPLYQFGLCVGKPSETLVTFTHYSPYHDSFFGCIKPEFTVDQILSGRVNGKMTKLHKHNATGHRTYYGIENFTLVDTEDITAYLMKLFTPKKFILNVTGYLSETNCFVWKMPWNKVNIVCYLEYMITPEDISRFLENETATDISLAFHFSTNGIFEEPDDDLSDDERQARGLEMIRQARASLLNIPKRIKCEEFLCNVLDFISVDDLINSQCKNITFYHQVIRMSDSDLNKLLKTWKTGEYMTNLELLRMTGRYETNGFTPAVIEGIELETSNNGDWIIKRETDNVLASVGIDNDLFHFWVQKKKVEEERK